MKLLEYLRPALQKSEEVQAILTGFQVALDALWDRVETGREQLNVENATWGLDYWESALGLSVEPERPAAFRRSRILARLRGQGTTTAESIRNVAASFSNGEVEVTEHPETYTVDVRFVEAVGLPPNLEDLKKAIAEVIPAHLAVRYISTIKTWDDVKNRTWGESAGMTWETLRGGSL